MNRSDLHRDFVHGKWLGAMFVCMKQVIDNNHFLLKVHVLVKNILAMQSMPMLLSTIDSARYIHITSITVTKDVVPGFHLWIGQQ